MKTTLLFALALVAQSTLFAQQWVDTTYHPSGEIHRLYFQRMVGNGDSIPISALFVRGLKEGDTVEPFPLTDSIQTFDTAGQRIPAATFIQPRGGRNALIEETQGKFTVIASKPQWSEVAPTQQFYARIGDTVSSTVVLAIPAEDQAKPTPKRSDKQRNIKTAQPLLLEEGKAFSADFQLEVEAGNQYQTLRYQFPSGQEQSFTFTTRGYHLQEADFQELAQLNDQHTLHLSGQTTLYLYLDSAEKLLTIHREGKVLEKIPVGRQLDAIDLRHLAQGNYLLDIVNLRTGEHRYHGLHL
ncbi:hypothetical protein QWY85_00210 [Neolewinella lacunae]|uniref:Uncharacterized protein n=1 Tax=Neolewinella lacunae TaxID=1517758 RepID=A0A923PRD9_9BACT|nr:hypothetical protein [Neolewinella lacunae]MBC6995347.1 hypothetical protein [Neolewinella lacunae]MDN3633059.1 hypothetical protein [Neolewinella lacunae]